MSTHISSHFNQELESIRTEVMAVGGLVEKQLQGVLHALSENSADGLQKVINDDQLINDLTVKIDEECLLMIARRQPAAGDLRFIITVSRITVDLERIGDELKKIARYTLDLLEENKLPATAFYNSHRIAEMTTPMIQRALDAFARLDESAIIDIAKADKKLDTDYRQQLRTIISFMTEEPRNVSAWVDVMMINKAVERIGDHCRNLAEHVVYLVRGIDVRNASTEEIKKQLQK